MRFCSRHRRKCLIYFMCVIFIVFLIELWISDLPQDSPLAERQSAGREGDSLHRRDADTGAVVPMRRHQPEEVASNHRDEISVERVNKETNIIEDGKGTLKGIPVDNNHKLTFRGAKTFKTKSNMKQPTARVLKAGDVNGSHIICESTQPDPSEDDWRVINGTKVYSYSAYFDDRESVGGPLVRVTALGLQQSHVTVDDMHCQFTVDGLPKSSISSLAKYTKIYPSSMWADEYTAHWLECYYPKDLMAKYGYPTAIAIVTKPCDRSSYSLKVKYKNKERSGFGLCLPSIYVGDDGVGIAEWIVLHKLLGYRRVIMYNAFGHVKRDSNIGKVIQLYQTGYDKNISVQLIPWNIPDVKKFYFAQHSVINDCIYRIGQDTSYATVCDKDEVIIPLKHRSIPDFIKSIETDQSGAYMFQHEMFNTNEQKEIAEEQMTKLNIKDVKSLQLKSLIHTYHMGKPHPEAKIRSKTMYNLDRTISADIHFPKVLVRKFLEILIPEDQAVLYHYRHKPPEKWLKAVPYVNETRVHMFYHQLLAEVADVIKRAGI